MFFLLLFDHVSISDPGMGTWVGWTDVVEPVFCLFYINAEGGGFRACISLLSVRDQEVLSLRLLFVYVCLSVTCVC